MPRELTLHQAGDEVERYREVQDTTGKTVDVFHQGPRKPVTEVTIPLRGDTGYAQVLICGDLHTASVCYNEGLAEATRQYVLDNKIPVIIPGIDPDMQLRGSKSEEWRYRMTPAEELIAQANFLKPIAEANLLLGITDDNHGLRWQKANGESYALQLCLLCGCPEAYLGWQGFLRVFVKNIPYLFLVYHGKGASTTPSGRLNAAAKMMQVLPDADVYVSGHVHHATAYDHTLLKDSGSYVEQGQKLIVVSGSMLNYFGLYAETLAYMPGKMGAKIISLRGDVKYAEARVGGYL